VATVTSYTAERMKQIEDASVVSGAVSGNNLFLTRYDNTQIDAGNVRGPQGIQGPIGVTSIVVCTSATRPTGINLFEGLGIWETNTKRFYIFDGTSWVYSGGIVICTSSTRPTSPPTGMEIFETNTGLKWIWTGAAWIPAGPRGLLASVNRTNNPAASIAEAVALTLPATTLPANRLIKIEGTWYNSTAGAGEAVIVRIREGTTIGGTLLCGTAVVMAMTGPQVGTGNGGTLTVTYSPTAGVKQWVLDYAATTLNSATITAGVGVPMTLSVYDVGGT
jgi:hypothetical protein